LTAATFLADLAVTLIFLTAFFLAGLSSNSVASFVLREASETLMAYAVI
tara:strand:+ start:506 stop:652 length:147 start_codon:yes stop_codon:yes gene_type:complete